MSDFTAQRIVSLQPSASAILDALGAADRIVACTRYCLDVCPGLADGRAIVADSWTAQAAEILHAAPDLVIAAVPYQPDAVTQILKAGCRFLGLAPRSLQDIYTDIALIAGCVGRGDSGAELVCHMQQSIAQVRSRAAAAARPRVFCEEWGKPLIASQSWVAELVQAAGGDFLAEPGKQITPGQVLALNPDILVAAWCGAGDRVPLEKIVRERGWESTPAALHRRVFCIRDEFLNTPAPTLLAGLHALAAAIHPQLFPEFEAPRRISRL